MKKSLDDIFLDVYKYILSKKMVKDTFQFFDYSILTLSFSWSVGLLPFCRTQAFKYLPINLEASSLKPKITPLRLSISPLKP